MYNCISMSLIFFKSKVDRAYIFWIKWNIWNMLLRKILNQYVSLYFMKIQAKKVV